jgi:prepilin-type processing-associated H-X9-DG protein
LTQQCFRHSNLVFENGFKENGILHRGMSLIFKTLLRTKTRADGYFTDNGKQGFTIMELIVTVNVVVILALLIVPVISRRKEEARRIHCASNLRQIGRALAVYANDYHGLLPDCTTNNPDFDGSDWPWDLHRNLVDNLQSKGLARDSFYCPSNPGMNDEWHWNFSHFQPEKNVRVVGYLFLLNGGINVPESLGHADLSNSPPANSELVVDVVGSTYEDYTRIAGRYMDRTSHLLGSRPAGGNILYVDNHVKWRDFYRMKRQINVTLGVSWDY